MEVKYDIFRYRDEGTWTWLSTLRGLDSILKFVVTLDYEPSESRSVQDVVRTEGDA